MKNSAKKGTKKRLCLQAECNQEPKQRGYCRLHYIANWRLVQQNEKIKAEKRLNAYVDRLSKKYPKDYLERIKEGLESEEKFKESVNELDLDSETYSETDREFLEKFSRTIKGED